MSKESELELRLLGIQCGFCLMILASLLLGWGLVMVNGGNKANHMAVFIQQFLEPSLWLKDVWDVSPEKRDHGLLRSSINVYWAFLVPDTVGPRVKLALTQQSVAVMCSEYYCLESYFFKKKERKKEEKKILIVTLVCNYNLWFHSSLRLDS